MVNSWKATVPRLSIYHRGLLHHAEVACSMCSVSFFKVGVLDLHFGLRIPPSDGAMRPPEHPKTLKKHEKA